MFSDKSNSTVSFPSNWESLTTSEENSTQTADLVKIDKDGQTIQSKSCEVQTDTFELAPTSVNYDETMLASFLNKIGPKVIEELDKSSKSKAFLSYHMPDEDSLTQDAKCLYNLIKPKSKIVEDLKVNSLTWSCTGSVVILGLGVINHVDWCSHTGFIHFYNINRNTSINMSPTKILEATSCVTSIAAHPFEPFILASGLYRGNIILWNLQQEGAECVISVPGHNDQVSQITWNSSNLIRPQLISAGLDCRLLFWNTSLTYDLISVKESFILNQGESDTEAGITCFSFLTNRPKIFVAAVEGGKIFHCCLDSANSALRVDNKTTLKNPIVAELGGHKGLVTCLTFSPYHNDLFLSLGTDQEIHVNSISELTPLKVIWCETQFIGTAWSPSQANIFISWGHSSEISVYDSKNGNNLCFLKTNEIPTICALDFNLKSPKLVAVGDVNGKGYVWKIPQNFKTGQ